MKIRITVMPRKAIADPQGRSVGHVLHSLGYESVADVRIGKTIDVTLKDVSHDEALEKGTEMAKAILANNVIEDFTVEVLK